MWRLIYIPNKCVNVTKPRQQQHRIAWKVSFDCYSALFAGSKTLIHNYQCLFLNRNSILIQHFKISCNLVVNMICTVWKKKHNFQIIDNNNMTVMLKKKTTSLFFYEWQHHYNRNKNALYTIKLHFDTKIHELLLQ
jgi:hypothetical protein